VAQAHLVEHRVLLLVERAFGIRLAPDLGQMLWLMRALLPLARLALVAAHAPGTLHRADTANARGSGRVSAWGKPLSGPPVDRHRAEDQIAELLD
jgi:hypothetical protein